MEGRLDRIRLLVMTHPHPNIKITMPMIVCTHLLHDRRGQVCCHAVHAVPRSFTSASKIKAFKDSSLKKLKMKEITKSTPAHVWGCFAFINLRSVQGNQVVVACSAGWTVRSSMVSAELE